MMRALKRPYPSFTFALTQESHPMCAPMFDVAYIRPYKRSKLCRAIDLEDTLMMTEGGRYRALLDDDSDTLASLEDAISSEVDQGRIRLRRPSLSTLVIDLALTVRRSFERLRAVNKEKELEFVMVTQ